MDMFRVVKIHETLKKKQYWNGSEHYYCQYAFSEFEYLAYLAPDIKSLTTKIRRCNTKYNQYSDYYSQQGVNRPPLFEGCYIEVINYNVIAEMPMVKI